MLEQDRLIKTSRFVVHTGFLVNRFFLAAVALGLLASWIFKYSFTTLLMQPPPGTNLGSETTGLRLMLLLGIAMSVAIDRLFAALNQIIETARAGIHSLQPTHAGCARLAGPCSFCSCSTFRLLSSRNSFPA